VLTCEEAVWGASVNRGVEKVTEGWCRGQTWVEGPLSGSHLAIYLLTPWSRVLLEKLTSLRS
jgi:hypothetical protein